MSPPPMMSISVRRGSAYFSATSRSSSAMICIRRSRELRIDWSRSTSFRMSAYSAAILSRSRPVRRESRSARMASACAAESHGCGVKSSRVIA